jgi:hypothetical protein
MMERVPGWMHQRGDAAAESISGRKYGEGHSGDDLLNDSRQIRVKALFIFKWEILTYGLLHTMLATMTLLI